MPKYDLENLLSDIKATMLASFNTKLAEIDAEKADAITLKTIDSQAYSLQQLNGKMLNFDPCVVYGVDDIPPSQSKGPFVAKKYSISVIVIVVDSGQDIEIGARMYRYLRALEEVFTTNWKNPYGVTLQIQSLVPVPLTHLNSSETYRAVGVSLEANLS